LYGISKLKTAATYESHESAFDLLQKYDERPPGRGFACPDGVRVGWGVSEVLAAFCTTVAGMVGASALSTSYLQ
jgi:hypothetical protein